ncbi:hypothetical protein B0H19DRAFT_1066625 [Mycena capillaripes]|nr:hypothetical protein B0H19DRAFT_1066625 [Mycena capillaripes]
MPRGEQYGPWNAKITCARMLELHTIAVHLSAVDLSGANSSGAEPRVGDIPCELEVQRSVIQSRRHRLSNGVDEFQQNITLPPVNLFCQTIRAQRAGRMKLGMSCGVQRTRWRTLKGAHRVSGRHTARGGIRKEVEVKPHVHVILVAQILGGGKAVACQSFFFLHHLFGEFPLPLTRRASSLSQEPEPSVPLLASADMGSPGCHSERRHLPPTAPLQLPAASAPWCASGAPWLLVEQLRGHRDSVYSIARPYVFRRNVFKLTRKRTSVTSEVLSLVDLSHAKVIQELEMKAQTSFLDLKSFCELKIKGRT